MASNKHIWASIPGLIALFLCFSAVTALARPAEKTIPTKITSDEVNFDQNNQKVTFSGNVVVTRQDMIMKSNKLTVFLILDKPKNADKSDPAGQEANATPARPSANVAPKEIDRIVATGNVRINRGTREGICQTATYVTKTNVVTMEGDPLLRETDTKNQISGEVILFNLTTNQSQVLRGKNKRVEAVFFTNSEDGQ